jgi:uroporphyrinogen-III decarboxylase
MYKAPEVLHAFLQHLTEAIIAYAGYQIESGAQVMREDDTFLQYSLNINLYCLSYIQTCTRLNFCTTGDPAF